MIDYREILIDEPKGKVWFRRLMIAVGVGLLLVAVIA